MKDGRFVDLVKALRVFQLMVFISSSEFKGPGVILGKHMAPMLHFPHPQNGDKSINII